MLKHKTSVLFANNSGKEKKAIQVPTTILLSWRKYLWALSTIIVVLCCLICFLIFKKTSSYYTSFYQAKLERANNINKEVNLSKLKSSFQAIDQNIEQINKMLAERGLKQLEIKNTGGPVEALEMEDTDEAAAFYAKEMTHIKEVLENTPIGLPHFGEQTSGFGFRNNPFGGGAIEGHKGLDFRGTYGEAIQSTADGVVEFAGTKGGYGNCVILKHKNGFHTLYGHLSKISIKENQKIVSGQKIGELGSSGRSTGPHLHYEVHINGERVDPSRFVKK